MLGTFTDTEHKNKDKNMVKYKMECPFCGERFIEEKETSFDVPQQRFGTCKCNHTPTKVAIPGPDEMVKCPNRFCGLEIMFDQSVMA